MKILVCDDEQIIVDEIETKIKSFIDSHKKVTIKTLTDERKIRNEVKINKYDIAYLDIEIGDTNGITIANELMKRNPSCLFIFITNYHTYISDALSTVSVFQYLLKPLDPVLFETTFYQALKKYDSLQAIRAFNTSIGKKYINIHDIIYLETYYTRLTIKTNKESYISNVKNIKDFKNILSKFNFIITHQSYYVNLEYIKTINKDTLTLYNDKVLPISPRRRKEILDAYHRFLVRRSFENDINGISNN